MYISTVTIGALEMRKELLTDDLILNIKDDAGSDWYDLGIALGIEATKVRNLRHDYPEVRERAHRVLEIWIEKNGREATVGRLACALIRIKRKRIADKLLGM